MKRSKKKSKNSLNSLRKSNRNGIHTRTLPLNRNENEPLLSRLFQEESGADRKDTREMGDRSQRIRTRQLVHFLPMVRIAMLRSAESMPLRNILLWMCRIGQ